MGFMQSTGMLLPSGRLRHVIKSFFQTKWSLSLQSKRVQCCSMDVLTAHLSLYNLAKTEFFMNAVLDYI